jgi:hypothetical protein
MVVSGIDCSTSRAAYITLASCLGWETNAAYGSHSGLTLPDRLDTLVWAITDLMVGRQPKPARSVYINFIER